MKYPAGAAPAQLSVCPTFATSPAPRRRIPANAADDGSDAQPHTEASAEEVTDLLQVAAERWLRLLKRIRRAAAPVRDLDVHRKLLETLTGGGHRQAKPEAESAEASQEPALTDSADSAAAATISDVGTRKGR